MAAVSDVLGRQNQHRASHLNGHCEKAGISEVNYKHFSRDEFVCKETGENEIQDRFIRKLDVLRGRCGFPFVITSGYRSPNHSIEAAKDKPGQHSSGRCADIACTSDRKRLVLLREALILGFTGVGVNAKFIHLDERDAPGASWVY